MSEYKFPYIVNVCYVINDAGEVLLQKKAHGFGKGKWNGPGGKVRDDEKPEESTIREIKEETGLILIKLKKVGELEFIFVGKESWNNYMHVYLCRDFSGTPIDQGEGELQWFNPTDIPYDQMWEDDEHWLPRALEGKWVNMRFYFKDDTGTLMKHEKLI